jgi:hypothetical protein
MGKRKESVSGDNTLRAFYVSCGLKPEVVEGAIKQRHEEPTTSVRKAKAVATWKATRRAKLTKDDR